MVCLYCSNKTQVTNSRLQKRSNEVWRRRQCAACGAIFSSLERAVYDSIFAVQVDASRIIPFSRDTLFLSIYDACRHRPEAISDAAALTDTVLGKLVAMTRGTAGALMRETITTITADTLQRFDSAAHVHYRAYHPL